MEMITCSKCKTVLFGLEQSEVFKVTGEARVHIKCEKCQTMNHIDLYEYQLRDSKIVNTRRQQE